MLDKGIICDSCKAALQEYRAETKPAGKIYDAAIAGPYEKFRSIVGDCGCVCLCARCADAKEEYDKAIEEPGEIYIHATQSAWKKLQETRGKCCDVSCLELYLLQTGKGK